MNVNDRPSPQTDAFLAEADPDYDWKILSARCQKLEKERDAALESGGGNIKPTVSFRPCGGCGQTDPHKQCLGCFHPFEPSLSYEELLSNTLKLESLLEWFEENPDVRLSCEFGRWSLHRRKPWYGKVQYDLLGEGASVSDAVAEAMKSASTR